MTQADQLAKALEIARASICADREALFRCHVDPATQTVKDEDGLLGLTEYDKVIEDIDEALAAHSAQASTTGAATTGAAVLPEQAVAWLVNAGNGKYTRGIYESLEAAESFACCDGDSITPLYASPPQVAEPLTLTDWQVKELAHRGAFLFKQATDQSRSDTYTFNEYCLLDFARAILHAATLQQEKQG